MSIAGKTRGEYTRRWHMALDGLRGRRGRQWGPSQGVRLRLLAFLWSTAFTQHQGERLSPSLGSGGRAIDSSADVLS